MNATRFKKEAPNFREEIRLPVNADTYSAITKYYPYGAKFVRTIETEIQLTVEQGFSSAQYKRFNEKIIETIYISKIRGKIESIILTLKNKNNEDDFLILTLVDANNKRRISEIKLIS